MKPTITPQPTSKKESITGRFEGYLAGARLGLLIGLLPTCVYWYAFRQFGTSNLPWEISLAIEIFTPAVVYAHYYLNRNTRRLIWEGAAVCIQFLPLWLSLGSYWIFYFGFAPISNLIRMVALTLGLGVTIFWTLITWRAFERETIRQGLIERLYEERETSISFSTASDLVTAMLQGLPGSSIVIPSSLVSALGPVLLAYTITSSHASTAGSGPHGVFIILSILSIPITCWFLTKFFLRLAYFHIYLPLKLERATGKKVIRDA